MESFILSTQMSPIVVPIVILILGIASGLYMLDQWKDKKRMVKDAADDRLNEILEKTVKELSEKVSNLEKREKELTKEMNELRRENVEYLNILQGRDKKTLIFYEKSFESMEVLRETNKIVLSIVKSIEKSSKNIDKLVMLISENIKKCN